MARLSCFETVCKGYQVRFVSMKIRAAGLIVLAITVSGGMAIAQVGDDGPQGPAMAMGSGRMVRGTVSAVAGDRISMKTEAGDTYSIALSANTRLMKERVAVKPADIHVGDGIGAMGEVDQPTKTVHALFVSVVDAEQIKKMREAMGKTWISGKVTAIDETKLTILRSDKVTQVITVDEDTSFKRGGRGMNAMMQGGGGPVAVPPGGNGGGGESITLADVKVGDNVAGQGSIKGGVFVPTTLAVMDPAQQRRRRDGAATPQ